MSVSLDEGSRVTLAGVRLVDLARDPALGTPTYVYDLGGMEGEVRALRAGFDGAPHLIAYAVKANSAGPVVRALAAEGCGADVVSAAEMMVALRSGIAPDKVVFSGVAKTDDEIRRALAAGIHALQLESVEEVSRVAALARALGVRARVAFRINPAAARASLDTHDHIATGHDAAKFGVPLDDVPLAVRAALASEALELVGLTMHIGSQFTTVTPYVAGAKVLFAQARAAREAGAALRYVDTGGGFGIDYGKGCDVRPADFVRAVREEQRASRLSDLALHVEPGRSLVAAHGVLLSSVIQSKSTTSGGTARRWLMIDAGMNDLLRPALYQARHRIVPLERVAGEPSSVRVVGPVCESSDDFGAHDLPLTTTEVAILDAGAYGFTMASRYNGRPLPAEVFLRDGVVVARTLRKPLEAWVDDCVSIGG